MSIEIEDAQHISGEAGGGGGMNGRALILGALLAVLFSAINGYLQLNLGMSFGYGAVAVIAAYSLFHKLGGGSSRRELAYVLITSISTLGIYNRLGFVLYMLQNEEGLNFPIWMAPPKEAVLTGSLNPSYWITPIAFLIIATLLTSILGLVISTVLREQWVRSRRMIWPSSAANCSLVDACMTGGGSARLVGIAAIIGFVVTFLQHLPKLWGYDLTSLELTPYLPDGFVFAVSLSIAFVCIGYMINVNTSLSLMASGLVTYLMIAPILISRGIVGDTGNTMALYNDLLFKFSIGPALGVLLLGGILLSILVLVRSKLSKKPGANDADEEASLGYIKLYKLLVKGLLSNRRYSMTVLSIAALLFALAYLLNPFAPFPPIYALGFTLYSFLVASFVEMVLITKMSGETGTVMGAITIFLYDLPLFSTGYRGYTGYWTYNLFRPSPGTGNVTLPYYKYRDQLDVSWWDILKAKIVGWVPTIIFSALFTIVLWRYVGFGTPTMPAVSLIQSRIYLQMLTSGNIVGVLNPWTFVAGGVLGSLLEVFTPVSMMGLAMGMFLPPHYILPFGVGGLIRYYTERKFGKEFYKEKGRLVVTGLMASSLLVQVIMTILTNFF